MGRVAEADPNRGPIDGAAPDVVAFVVPGRHGAVLAELAEGAFDGVALLVAVQVGQCAGDLQIDAAQFKHQARIGLSRCLCARNVTPDQP